jgi:hypothetical protein
MVLGQKDEYSPNTWLSSPNLRTKFKRQKNINAQIWILQNLEKINAQICKSRAVNGQQKSGKESLCRFGFFFFFF